MNKPSENSIISPEVTEDTEKLRKLKLIDGLNDIPTIHLNRDEIRSAIEEGRH